MDFEDILGILVIGIIWACSAFMGGFGKKKQRGKRAVPQRTEMQKPQAAKGKPAQASPKKKEEKKTIQDAFEARQAVFESHEGEDPCHPDGKALSLNQEDDMPHEGDDPCHPLEHMRQEDSPVYDSPIYQPQDNDSMRRLVLEGIIMSEILRRPKDRRTGR